MSRNLSKASKHFKVKEFACKNGVPYPQKWVKKRLRPLCENLEVIREYFDSPIIITSGYRPPEYNRKVGGARFSQHVVGRAADFKVVGVSAREVARVVRRMMREGKISKGGIGSYSTWVHLDIRGRIAYWRMPR